LIQPNENNSVERTDVQQAKIDVSVPGASAAVSGSGMVVVVIVALLGIIIVAVMAVGVAQRAVDRATIPPPVTVDRPHGDGVASVQP
jgi:hypothetical protein